MREVVVLGVGLHKFGRWPDKRVEDIGREAILDALGDAGVEFREIESVYCGHTQHGMGTGLRVAGEVGLTGIPIINVEVACTSSSTCVRLAYQAIAAGIYDICLCVGFDKMEKGLIAIAEPGSLEEVLGLAVLPGDYAMKARKHMNDYGSTAEQFAQVSVKSHKNGVLNPYAQYQKAMTLEEVLNSRMIADPITLYQCSPTSDGASAAVVCAKEKAKRFSGKGITIAGWAAGSPEYDGMGREIDDLSETMQRRCGQQAYEIAGVGPKDINVAQAHDAFTPGEIFAIEAMGFCPPGDGGRWTAEGKTDIGGEIPVNTDGGLISRGHPLGATGIAQMVEIIRQLRGEAGPRQVPNSPKVGLCHNMGIGGCTITILKK